jgi:hypothetical protein
MVALLLRVIITCARADPDGRALVPSALAHADLGDAIEGAAAMRLDVSGSGPYILTENP